MYVPFQKWVDPFLFYCPSHEHPGPPGFPTYIVKETTWRSIYIISHTHLHIQYEVVNLLLQMLTNIIYKLSELRQNHRLVWVEV